MKPMEIILIGAIIVIVGGIVGAIGTFKQNKASSAKSDKQLAKIQELNDQNLRLSESILVLSDQNTKLSNKINELNEKNNTLIMDVASARNDVAVANKEAYNNTFGGKSIRFVNGLKLGMFHNFSDLPVYDIKVFATDYSLLLKCEKGKDIYGSFGLSKICYESCTKEYDMTILHGNTDVELVNFPIDGSAPYKYSFKFITKRGTYYQQVLFIPKVGYASRVLEQNNISNYYSQYNNRNLDEKFLPESRSFTITEDQRSFVVKGFNIDWDKEFPLPVSFTLI